MIFLFKPNRMPCVRLLQGFRAPERQAWDLVPGCDWGGAMIQRPWVKRSSNSTYRHCHGHWFCQDVPSHLDLHEVSKSSPTFRLYKVACQPRRSRQKGKRLNSFLHHTINSWCAFMSVYVTFHMFPVSQFFVPNNPSFPHLNSGWISQSAAP